MSYESVGLFCRLGVAVIGAAFFPVSKLIWVLSVRKLQRKMRRELSEQETEAQLRRARILAVFIVVIFSFLFNAHVIGVPGNG